MLKNLKRLYLLCLIMTSVVTLALPVHAAKKGQGEYQKHPEGYSIKEAYKFFKRERTPFDPKKSKLPENDVKYLDHFFFVTDMALLERVDIMQYFFVVGNNVPKKYMPDYIQKIDDLIKSFEMIEAPSEDMKEVEKLLVLALEEQRDFFKEWSNLRGTAFTKMREKYSKHLLVQSSHTKLQRVYTQLMLIYPDEDPYNHKAFSNHLAALDFEPWK